MTSAPTSSASSPSRSDDPFTPAVVGFLVAGLVAIFALSAVLTARTPGEEGGYRATRASPSAIGHAGFYALLRALDRPVGYSKVDGVAAAGEGGLLVLEEPDPDLVATRRDLNLAAGPDVLVVLPKHWGTRDRSHAGWVDTAGLLDLAEPRKILHLIGGRADVFRAATAPTLPASRLLAHLPKLEAGTQLLRGKGLTPIIGTRDAMLLAEVATDDPGHVYVLADPDVLENHGITEPDNARFAVDLVDALWSGRGSIVFDETVHGAVVAARNPLQLLFEFPFNLVLGQALLALGLLLWATTSRFGGPEALPPPLAAGKGPIITNAAALMERAGHRASVLRRYIRMTLHEAGRALHAPAALDDADLAAWLDRVGAARGLAPTAAGILARSTGPGGSRAREAGLFEGARDIHRWKERISDGSAGRQHAG